MQMTGAGNTVFRRSFFLACGGFPQHQLFQELGGEDGALGIATTQISSVATAFNDVGVLHYCREGMHAERLLNAILFNEKDPNVTEEKVKQANLITKILLIILEIYKTVLIVKGLVLSLIRLNGAKKAFADFP